MPFPRWLSRLNEIDRAWLIGMTYVSESLRPFLFKKTNIISTIGSECYPFTSIPAESYFNRFGELRINNIESSSPIVTNTENGVAKISLAHDSTLQEPPEGKLSITPKILLQGELDMRAKAPIQLVLDPDVKPNDVIGSEVTLLYDEDDFSINDQGALKTVDLIITAQGAIGVRKADWSLGEMMSSYVSYHWM